MPRLTLKKDTYGSLPVTFDTTTLPSGSSIYNYGFQLTVRRTLSTPTPDLFLDSNTVPSQFSIQSSTSILVTTLPTDTSLLQSGTYYWECQLSSGSAPFIIFPATSYGDLIILDKIT
jgi:hypothetical protein